MESGLERLLNTFHYLLQFISSKFAACMKGKHRIDASNNRGNWNHFKISETIPEQLTGKARKQGTTENKDIGHCTRKYIGKDIYKQAYYRPIGFWEAEVSRKTLNGVGKGANLKQRPPLPPRKYYWYSFLLEAASITGA
jgi:hypothetical protein